MQSEIGVSHEGSISYTSYIFVLLSRFCHLKKINSTIWMMSPIKGRSVIDTSKTVANNHDTIQDLLAMDDMLGCDTVTPYFGIRKGKGLLSKFLKDKSSL